MTPDIYCIYGISTIGAELKNKRIDHEMHETEEQKMTRHDQLHEYASVPMDNL